MICILKPSSDDLITLVDNVVYINCIEENYINIKKIILSIELILQTYDSASLYLIDLAYNKFVNDKFNVSLLKNYFGKDFSYFINI
jgi:hypothetical protein